MPHPYRLGFAVKVVGPPELPTADLRRHGSGPHLAESLRRLARVVPYLADGRFGMYRLASGLAPYGTHPDLPAFAWRRQHDEAAEALVSLGAAFRAADVRLSSHPSQFVVVNSPDEGLVRRSIAELEADAALLDRLGAGPEARVIVHMGGAYGDHAAARERWVRNIEGAPEPVRRRVAIENDERIGGFDDVLWIAERAGIAVVVDLHHLRCHRDDGSLPWADALARAAATWPPGVRPKAHLSSPRPEGRLGAHADQIDPTDLARAIGALPCPFDLMLETKRKDESVRRARADLGRLAPALAVAEELPGPATAVGSSR